MWKRLSTKTILNHPRLHVVEDEVELPNKEKTHYLRFEEKGSTSTVIVLDAEKKILVIKEYFYVTDEWFYLFPGGFVPESENVENGMRRELEEETGITVKELVALGSFYTYIRRTPMAVVVFLAEMLGSTVPRLEKEEQIETFWYTEEEIDQIIKNGDFKNAPSLAAWALYKTNKMTLE